MFETVGEKPRWVLALEVFREHAVGDIVAYADIGAALDSADRRVVQQAAMGARKRLLEEDQRAIEAVPNKGYRIVEPSEHVRLAKSHERRSRRALVRGHKTITHVDMNALSDEGQRLALATAQGFARVLDAMAAQDKRISRVAKAQEALELRVDEGMSENAQRLADLEAEVARLKGAA